MTTQALVLIAIAAALTVLANLSMRHGLLAAGGLTFENGVIDLFLRLAKELSFVFGFLCYGAAAVVWFRVLSIAEVSTSYPILVGLTFTFVTIGAVWLFKESINAAKIGGIVVILVGILIVARS